MDLKLNDMRTLVSVSAKGIGLAIAVAPAGEACRVIVNGHRGEALSDTPGRRLGDWRAS